MAGQATFSALETRGRLGHAGDGNGDGDGDGDGCSSSV